MHAIAARTAGLPSAHRAHHHPRRRVAVVSTYTPRPCGIATFTNDLRRGLAASSPDLDVVVCAMDRDGLRYGPEVVVVLDQDDRSDYPAAARRLAAAGVDTVLIQHEFGIFGGPDGAWINEFADALTALGIPYFATLHTVLSKPSPGQAQTLRRLCAGAAGVTVFTPTAKRLCLETGVATAEQMRVVPHGAPTILRTGLQQDADVRPEVAALLDRLQDATIVSTFGLISPSKGLHTGIMAVAELAEDLPDLHYVIAGATHPEVVRQYGEHYRESLQQLADDLGVSDRICFIDHFLTDAEIAAVLAASDVFLTPYASSEQISSGALTFAVAAGVPAVSTAYHYAVDLLGNGAGLTVPPGDTAAFVDALRTMLTEPGLLEKATAVAHAVGEQLPWPAVAARFAEILRSGAPRRVGAAAERHRQPLLRTAATVAAQTA